MVRTIKKGRNGTLLMAGPNNASFGDVFRYDPSRTGEKSFTNLTRKLGQHKFQFPVSRFAITKVETGTDGTTKVPTDGSIKVTTDGNIKVSGKLTLEGMTKAVTFRAKLHFKDGMDGTVEMNGTLVVDRTDWGIDYGSEKHFYQSGDAILDEVKLLIKIVAKKINR